MSGLNTHTHVPPTPTHMARHGCVGRVAKSCGFIYRANFIKKKKAINSGRNGNMLLPCDFKGSLKAQMIWLGS